MARLMIDGKDFGPHAFVMQLRSMVDHQPLRRCSHSVLPRSLSFSRFLSLSRSGTVVSLLTLAHILNMCMHLLSLSLSVSLSLSLSVCLSVCLSKNVLFSIAGIKVGDIGPKFGFQGIDNGFVSFNYVRIPRDSVRVSWIGVYGVCGVM
jgi:hypothetical protein